jgi:urease accessory protein
MHTDVAYTHQTHANPAQLVRHAHQRMDGAARIGFRRRFDGRTVLGDLFQRAPCRALFPAVESGEPPQAVLLTTSGGLTGGDRLQIEATVATGACATFTTQAAEKIYRAPADSVPASIRMHASVGEEGWVEWLAQETILFDGSSLDRRFSADLAPGARLLAVESLVFGRTAMQEGFTCGFLHDAWRIRRGGRLVWADALRLQGDVRQQQSAPFGFGTAVACSTVLYAGADAAGLLDDVREVLAGCDVSGGATTFDDILLVRLLSADAARLRRAVIALAAAIRSIAAGLPARLPRVWSC